MEIDSTWSSYSSTTTVSSSPYYLSFLFILNCRRCVIMVRILTNRIEVVKTGVRVEVQKPPSILYSQQVSFSFLTSSKNPSCKYTRIVGLDFSFSSEVQHCQVKTGCDPYRTLTVDVCLKQIQIQDPLQCGKYLETTGCVDTGCHSFLV